MGKYYGKIHNTLIREIISIHQGAKQTKEKNKSLKNKMRKNWRDSQTNNLCTRELTETNNLKIKNGVLHLRDIYVNSTK